MRKRLLLLCVTLSFLAEAQTVSGNRQQDVLGKGHLNIGLSGGEGYRGTYPKTDYLTARIHYFLKDGWSVAAEGRYLLSNVYRQSGNTPDYRLWGGGVSTRYYFLRSEHFAVFAHMGAIYGRSTFHLTPDAPGSPGDLSSSWQTEVGLGVQYRIARRWSVEAMGGRSWLTNTSIASIGFPPPATFNRWQVSVGINYRLR